MGVGWRAGVRPYRPLLLDEEEAVEAAVGLRMAGAESLAATEETSVGTLVKMEQGASRESAASSCGGLDVDCCSVGWAPRVADELLTAVASAIRDRERFRIDHAGQGGGVWVDAAPDEPGEGGLGGRRVMRGSGACGGFRRDLTGRGG